MVSGAAAMLLLNETHFPKTNALTLAWPQKLNKNNFFLLRRKEQEKITLFFLPNRPYSIQDMMKACVCEFGCIFI